MTLNYLDAGATANGKPARMARYFARTMHSHGAVAIVATLSPTSWRAYIGACEGDTNYDEAAEQVAAWGVKLAEPDARYFFPDLTLPYDTD